MAFTAAPAFGTSRFARVRRTSDGDGTTSLLELDRAHPSRLADRGMSIDAQFADFVRENMPALSRTAYLMTGSHASAEDLVQETLLRLYQRREWVLNADVPLAYARRALANQLVNDKRRRSSTELVLADLPEPDGVSDDTGLVADRDVVWRVLSTLPERQRVALVLRFYHDLPDAEVAEALQCRVGTVRSLVSRALSSMRADPAVLAQLDGGVR